MTQTASAQAPLFLNGFRPSGHSHRAELMLCLLKLPYEFRHVDLPSSAHKSQDFLKLDPFGTVPVLQDGDCVVPDSVAILTYLATRYDPAGLWLPTGAVAAAAVQRWLSVAFAAIGAWLRRMEALPGFLPMPGRTP